MDDLTILQATQQLEYSFLITKKSSRISCAQFGTRWIMGLPLYPHPLNMPNFFLIWTCVHQKHTSHDALLLLEQIPGVIVGVPFYQPSVIPACIDLISFTSFCPQLYAITSWMAYSSLVGKDYINVANQSSFVVYGLSTWFLFLFNKSSFKSTLIYSFFSPLLLGVPEEGRRLLCIHLKLYVVSGVIMVDVITSIGNGCQKSLK